VDFAGRTAFITGGSRGIGLGIARELARRGANVAVAGRSGADAERAAADIATNGINARGYACNVANLAEVQEAAARAITDLGSVDFLVANAGITRDKLLLRMTPADWDDVIATNLTGVYNCAKVFASHFVKQRRGRIVTISSVVGLTGNAGQANYAASKAGILGLTRSLAKELAPRGITANVVAPGYIRTDMTDDLSEEIQRKLLESIPLKRFGTVEDVANVVLFLLSGLADYVTGQVINCDGGMVMA